MKMLIIAISIGLSACAAIERSMRSGYATDEWSTSPADDYLTERSQFRNSRAQKELGRSELLSADSEAKVQNRLSVQRLEKDLQTTREKKQYYGYKPFFASDRERIEFLNLPTPEARERYAAAKNIAARQDQIAPDHQEAIENNDVTVGMTRKAVRESWGDPDGVETAGNPVYGNERWRYNRMAASSSGYDKQTRLIYFESGRVVGWEQY